MTRHVSVAMTIKVEQELLDLLIRPDGQEDLCLATYRPSTGSTRTTALISSVIPPTSDDRRVHGNATVMGRYVSRGAEIARKENCGLVLLHSHPGGSQWQPMSALDQEAEASYANLAREITGLSLVGMTLATEDTTWSARHWDTGTGREIDCTHADNVRVIGDRLAVSWNNALIPPPQTTHSQLRTISAWGERCQADLARRRVLVVGAGSVGLDLAVRLAASGLCRITVMDFDIVEIHNLDRLIGATPRDARLIRPKIHVALRQATTAATADNPNIEVSALSICEPEGLQLALDHDLIFSCVDRPWPRSVLNSLAYTDLIPVIDGGIAIDPLESGGMRNATWRSHVIRPGRPCMRCNRQLDLAKVIPDMKGLLDDPSYIANAEASALPSTQNVATLSVNVPAGLLAQYVSFSVAPAGFGDPGPLQYCLSTHTLDHLQDKIGTYCPVEPQEAVGDLRLDLTGRHLRAEQQRQKAKSVEVPIRLLRWLDNRVQKLHSWLDHTN
ncbi:ThiF family adenylyltransferase [Candidatus Poriferisocius sp.]|uniref:ThiF family adenylyltransferase n=1 Tax=Candidatus Poriferisocius sp. TaxID=3101276 RepID=UPI003B5B0AF2